MAAFLIMTLCLAVTVPFTAMAWAMKRTHCPECGAEVGPDADVMRILGG